MPEVEQPREDGAPDPQAESGTRALPDSDNPPRREPAGHAGTDAAQHLSQRLQAVGQMADGIAHDFNNILATVLGNLELMERRVSQGDQPWTDADRDRMLRFIGRATEAVHRGSALTSCLLALSRRQPRAPQPTDINAVLRDAVTLAASALGSRISIDLGLDAGLWTARADPGQVEAAVLTLCFNARYAMPDAGTVSIGTGNISREAGAPADMGPNLAAGDYVWICVAATACGAADDITAPASDPLFTTRDAAGAGPGLSQIEGMARQSGGDVTVHRQPGPGTKVTLYLPRAPAPESDANGPKAQDGHGPNAGG